MARERALQVTLGVVGVVGALTLWHLLSRDSTNLFFPPLEKIVRDSLAYWTSPVGIEGIRRTLLNLTRGLLLGVGAGVVVGLVLGQVTALRTAFLPLLEYVRAIPGTALIPVSLSIFGIGDPMKIFTIAMGSFFPILLNVIDGTRQIHGLWLDTGVVFGLSRAQRQLRIVLLALVPRIVAGMRICVPLSLIIAVTSEMFASSAGIGYVIANAQYTYNIGAMWSGLFLLGVIGVTFSVALRLVERSIRRWNWAEGTSA